MREPVGREAVVDIVLPVSGLGRRDLQFRFEVFNLLNRANLGLPSATLFNSRGRRNASAGRITRTVTTARQIQLALRFEF